MDFYECLNSLIKSRGLSQRKVEIALGFSNGAISKWKKYSPNAEKVQLLAQYFNVSVEYLMNGVEEPQQKEITLTPKDERDIARDLDSLMDKIETGQDSPLYYNGEEMDQESKELLRDAIGMSLRHLKIINKEKYNPHKNKK